MANPEHVAIVRQGADAIDDWYREHETMLADSDGTRHRSRPILDLAEADLDGLELYGADLVQADLTHATLRSANLDSSTLTGAVLRLASLQGAILINTDLRVANLQEANLSDAELQSANFRGATLDAATFRNVTLYETVFASTNLTGVIGLESALHLGPSTLDHRVLVRSGELPIEFLRGVGLPDEVIEFYRAQYGKPIQYFSSFISYARTDGEFVDRLHADLQDNGVRCWRDTEDMKIGDRMRSAIDRAIRIHDKVVLVLSERSIQSDWVESEVESALEKEREEGRTVLFPIRLDDSVMETDKAWAAEIRRTRNIGDFRGWKDHDSYQVAFQRVLRDLRPEAE